MIERLTDEGGKNFTRTTTIQDNGWTRIMDYYDGGTICETYEREKEKYDSNCWYEFYYHYMHYYPSCIVIVKTKGCLVEETLELLKKDPRVVIDDIKKVRK